VLDVALVLVVELVLDVALVLEVDPVELVVPQLHTGTSSSSEQDTIKIDKLKIRKKLYIKDFIK
jgi:hypothetical protein